MIESDIDRFHTYGSELAAAVENALPAWVRGAVERLLPRATLTEEAASRLDADIISAIEQAGEVVGRLRDLLARDIDDQWTNPLSILREAAVYPTAILSAHGVAPVGRDRHAQRIHPDDIYDLSPASFSDFGPEVHEQGILWGAAKAHLHLQRRKRS